PPPKPIQKHQWLLILIVAPLVARWLGHQSPLYAAGDGGIFHATRHVTWKPATSPIAEMPAAPQKGNDHWKHPYAQ
ncbi:MULTISPECIES: hypothetical protein, partial [Acidithiobacillus]